MLYFNILKVKYESQVLFVYFEINRSLFRKQFVKCFAIANLTKVPFVQSVSSVT